MTDAAQLGREEAALAVCLFVERREAPRTSGVVREKTRFSPAARNQCRQACLRRLLQICQSRGRECS